MFSALCKRKGLSSVFRGRFLPLLLFFFLLFYDGNVGELVWLVSPHRAQL